MTVHSNGPRNKEDNSASSFEVQPDVTPRREGGDDSNAESNSSDDRMDEKVIVNEQREHRIVNSPSQTAAYSSEGDNSIDEI